MTDLARISFGERRSQLTNEMFNRTQLRCLERWGVITSHLGQNQNTGTIVRVWKKV